MIAACMIDGDPLPHVVYLTKKRGLVNVITTMWCTKEQAAGEGVYQLPDNAPICQGCKDAIEAAKVTYAGAKAELDTTKPPA